MVASFVLALSLGAAACDGSSESKNRATRGKVEMRFRTPPSDDTEEPLPPGDAHTRVCPNGSSDCANPTSVAAVKWANGESYFTVYTANGRPTDVVPTPNDFLSRSPGNDGNGQHVTVRGHPGVLWLADAADFVLLWRERPGVWVRVAAEDVSSSKAEILRLAKGLRPAPWSEEEALPSPSSGNDGRIGFARTASPLHLRR
jgi:hypothetical protein